MHGLLYDHRFQINSIYINIFKYFKYILEVSTEINKQMVIITFFGGGGLLIGGFILNLKADHLAPLGTFCLNSATKLPSLYKDKNNDRKQKVERDFLIAGFLRISSEGQPAKLLF